MIKSIFMLALSFIVLAFCFYCVLKGLQLGFVSRRKGSALPKGRPTMFHVRELLVRQEKDMAIQTYCQIFGVSRKEAKKAVDELERHIENKH